jgi:hypothetical protein
VAASHLAVQAKGAGMVAELRNALGSDFAGVWFDNKTGRFHIGIVNDNDRPAVTNVLAARDLVNDTDLDAVKYTWDELAAAETGVTRRISVYASSHTARVGIDPSVNGLTVDVASDAAQQDVASFATTTGPAGDVPVRMHRVAPAALDVTPDACVFPNCDHPLRGGVRIENDQIIQCSNGTWACVTGCSEGALAVRSGSTFIITAGHCIKAGGTWEAQQANGVPHNIGPSGGSFVDASRGDAGAINVSNSSWWMQSGWTPETAAWNVDLDHPTTGSDYGYVGEFTCHFGYATGNPPDGSACGTTTAQNVYNIYYARWGQVSPLDVSTACSMEGDSGGPVIDGNVIVGFVSGGYCGGSGQEMVFEEAPNAASWLGGLTIATIF